MSNDLEHTRKADQIRESKSREFLEHQHYLRETDRAALDALTERYGRVVPPERIRAVRDLPTQFESREEFDKRLKDFSKDEPEPGERILGYSRGTIESAHVAVDHLEIPKTVYHERLHQLSDPDFPRKLGHGLTEGITEDLAVENLGANGTTSLNECYPVERSIANQIRRECGDAAIEQAYFKGDTHELRRCLDKTLGAPGIERLRYVIDQDLHLDEEVQRPT